MSTRQQIVENLVARFRNQGRTLEEAYRDANRWYDENMAQSPNYEAEATVNPEAERVLFDYGAEVDRIRERLRRNRVKREAEVRRRESQERYHATQPVVGNWRLKSWENPHRPRTARAERWLVFISTGKARQRDLDRWQAAGIITWLG